MHPKVDGRGLTIPTHICADGDHVIVQAKGRNALTSGKRYDKDYCSVISTR
jgi:ketosteroid isomerase-like protein